MLFIAEYMIACRKFLAAFKRAGFSLMVPLPLSLTIHATVPQFFFCRCCCLYRSRLLLQLFTFSL
jgi:hypothetical protein